MTWQRNEDETGNRALNSPSVVAKPSSRTAAALLSSMSPGIIVRPPGSSHLGRASSARSATALPDTDARARPSLWQSRRCRPPRAAGSLVEDVGVGLAFRLRALLQRFSDREAHQHFGRGRKHERFVAHEEVLSAPDRAARRAHRTGYTQADQPTDAFRTVKAMLRAELIEKRLFMFLSGRRFSRTRSRAMFPEQRRFCF